MNAKDRPSRDMILMGTVDLWASRGTCSRAAQGAIIVWEHRIISTGYNGVPMGMPHCEHPCTCNDPLVNAGRRAHDEGCVAMAPCRLAVHAEANAIAFAARYGTRTEGATMICSQSPCIPCAQMVINCGIKEVVYGQLYRDQSGLDLLRNAGIDTRLPVR